MDKKRLYSRTDVAVEFEKDSSLSENGIRVSEKNSKGFNVRKIDITTKEASDALGKPLGSYVNVNVGRIWLESDERFDDAANVITDELKALMASLSSSCTSVLVAGLGNRFIVSDAIGPLTVKGLTANRHIKKSDPELFLKLGSMILSAVAPGVTGQTGIEAADLIKNAVDTVKPDIVICVDALAARDVDRLGTAIQLSNNGIAPGSGIGNRRSAIDCHSLGIPVISVGVPTVVDSSTLVFGMLERAGVTSFSPQLEKELENGRSFFVTLKDADTVIYEISRLLSSALTSAFSV
jgi:spore protease